MPHISTKSPPNFTDMPIKIKNNSFYIASSHFLVTTISSISTGGYDGQLHVKDSASFIDFKRFNVICSSDTYLILTSE